MKQQKAQTNKKLRSQLEEVDALPAKPPRKKISQV
jgi:hypothetical protein